MIKKIILGNVCAGLIFAGGAVGIASAQSTNADEKMTAPKLDIIQAIEIAKVEVPGLVKEAELDNDDGVQIYEVEIVNADGIEMEVEIDANSGDVLEVEIDKKKGKKRKSKS